MIERALGPRLLELARWYPVVSLTGPRQSGKSTLAHHVFAGYDYVNLEDPAARSRALTDPTGFVENHGIREWLGRGEGPSMHRLDR